MTPAERQQWIIDHLRNNCAPREHVDILNRDFVDWYSGDTGATAYGTMYGANKCPTLARDLAALAKARRLVRSRTGISGMAGTGFPRWVWAYRLPPGEHPKEQTK
jgi:hypothetical protein